ncbi:hypothetical protein PLICRDRAFT_173959 [Plicaturopsis crispa FD-325 SS-3]|nr:hypothetical protein PLICRDRAFT_173959 [Plicaturopsis crispa FD-325 SS-3]
MSQQQSPRSLQSQLSELKELLQARSECCEGERENNQAQELAEKEFRRSEKETRLREIEALVKSTTRKREKTARMQENTAGIAADREADVVDSDNGGAVAAPDYGLLAQILQDHHASTVEHVASFLHDERMAERERHERLLKEIYDGRGRRG